MVTTRSQSEEGNPVTPEVTADEVGGWIAEPPAAGLGNKSWSRTAHWRQPFRSLAFEEAEAKAAEESVSMEMPRAGRDEVFTGRHGGLSLPEFEDRFLAAMSEIEMKAPAEKFTEEFAMLQMSRYLGGEASMVYRKYRPIVAAGQTKPGLSVTKEEIGAAEDSKSKLTRKGMVQMMFEILRAEFPAHTQEKMEEITKFAFKPGENLKSAYLRLEQLMEDTELRNPRDAAEDFLGALPYKQQMKVADAVHLTHNKMYTLQQVYEMADKILPADAYSLAYYDRRNHGMRGAQAPVSQVGSSSRERALPNVGIRRERAANSSSVVQPCSRCLGPHFTRECEFHWSGSRGQEACPACGRYGHTEQACWRKHPELRPANMGSVVTGNTPGAAVLSKENAERQHMVAMIAELQRKLDKATQANASTAEEVRLDNSDDAPTYMAVRKHKGTASKVARALITPEPDGEVESGQVRQFAKMPRSFEQLAGASSHPDKNDLGGSRVGMSRLSTEVMLKRVMEAPCLSLTDVGLHHGELRTVIHRWVATKNAVESRQVPTNHAQTWSLHEAPFKHQEGMMRKGGVALVKNEGRYVEIEGHAPLRVLIDTGAEPVLLGKRVKMALGLYGSKLEESSVKLSTSAGTKENVLGITKQPLSIVLNPRRPGECVIKVRCLVTDADNYDILMGLDATYWPALGVDPYQELAFYRPGWQRGEYDAIATLPLDLHRRGHKGSMLAQVAMVQEVEDKLLKCLTYAAEQWMEELEQEGEAEVARSQPTEAAGGLKAAQSSEAVSAQSHEASRERSDEDMQKDEEDLLAHVASDTRGVDYGKAYEPELCVAPDVAQVVASREVDVTQINWKPHPDGAVVMELFSGISTGLEAVLKAGVKVRKYVCCENNWNAQITARERVRLLQLQYPDLLPASAVKGFQLALPSNIRFLGRAHLRALGVSVDLLIAGWECQGMSSAGKGEGLQNRHSMLFSELMRVLKLVQEQPEPCWYIVENVPACFDRRERLRKDYQEVKSWLGEELLLDAVQFGSLSHRLRSFWTNVSSMQYLRNCRAATTPTVGDYTKVLEPGREVQAVQKDDKLPFYPVNKVGQPRRAWPTFFSVAKSHAFRNNGAGTLLNSDGHEVGDPTANEREAAMGFDVGTTNVAGLSENNRRKLLGRLFDLNTMQWLIMAGVAHQLSKQGISTWWPAAASRQNVVIPCNVARFDEEAVAERGGAMGDRIWVQSVLQQKVQRTEKPEVPVVWDINPYLTKEEQAAIAQLLAKYRHVFAFSVAELGRYSKRKFSLLLKSTEPIFRRRHRLSKVEWDLVEEKCQELAQAGLIRKSSSQYAAATVLPAKMQMAIGLTAECAGITDLSMRRPHKWCIPCRRRMKFLMQ